MRVCVCVLLAYSLHKENNTARMMLYKNRKAIFRSLDRDTVFFEIVAGVLQGDASAPYLYIISYHIYPTPPLGQDMTKGQFFKRSLTGLNSEFSFS